ncbi:MAG: type II toxin-antitoxin system RelE/ParE family toxin [Bacteroidetes bacterium]|nr:type II toxin-antitoxin system RelE/ParE family toxin [Bacteroidota bacterium]
MDFEITWTENAVESLDKIIQYLEKNWNDKEISKFMIKIKEFTDLLSKFPQMLQKTSKYQNIYRGPINKYTIITYRLKPKQKLIEIINIRASKEYIQQDR